MLFRSLEEGELVVTNGNFKIDAEIQIQAKPSMMTPSGGGGGSGEHAGHKMILPSEFYGQIRDLEAAYEAVAQTVEQGDAAKVTASFSEFSQAVAAVDVSLLTGHPRMLWKEFGMLLGNDAVEGSDATQPAEADRIFLLLKGHMRRMREQLDVAQRVAMEVRHACHPGDEGAAPRMA